MMAEEMDAADASAKQSSSDMGQQQLPMLFPGMQPDPSLFPVRTFRCESQQTIPHKVKIIKVETDPEEEAGPGKIFPMRSNASITSVLVLWQNTFTLIFSTSAHSEN
jgi:hypothetical protein